MKGITIRLERVKRGLTQAELAEKLGVSQVLISKHERGIYMASKETSSRIRRIFRQIDENGKGDAERKVYQHHSSSP